MAVSWVRLHVATHRHCEVQVLQLEGLRRRRHCQCPALCTSSQSGCRSEWLDRNLARDQRCISLVREACAGLFRTFGEDTLCWDMQANPAGGHVRTSGMSDGCARSSNGSTASARGGVPARRRLAASGRPCTKPHSSRSGFR